MQNNNSMTQAKPFPIGCLPKSVRNRILAKSRSLGISPALSAQCTLAAEAITRQATHDVKDPNTNEILPTSTNSMAAEKSGSGKTRAMQDSFGLPKEKLSENNQNYKKEKEDYLRAEKIWCKNEKALIKKRAELELMKDAPEYEEQNIFLKKKELLHMASKPKAPVRIIGIVDKIDASGIPVLLPEGVDSVSIVTDEAGSILFNKNINLMNDLCALSRRAKLTRMTRHNTEINANGCVSTYFSTQPDIFKMAQKNNPMIRQSGFLARNLILGPNQLPLSAYQQLEIEPQPVDTRHADNMQHSIDFYRAGNGKRFLLIYKKDAADKHISHIQTLPQLQQQYPNMDDWFSRSSEHLTKLAALIHLCEYDNGEISLQTLEAAWQITLWFAGEFHRTCVPIPVEIEHVATLFSWIQFNWPRLMPEHSSDGLYMYFDRSQLQRLVHGSLRKPDVLDSTLEHAEKMGWLMRVIYGQKTLIKVPKSRIFIQQIGFAPPPLSDPFALGSW